MSMDIDGEYKCLAENSSGVAETVAKVTVEGTSGLIVKCCSVIVTKAFLPYK